MGWPMIKFCVLLRQRLGGLATREILDNGGACPRRVRGSVATALPCAQAALLAGLDLVTEGLAPVWRSRETVAVTS